MIDNSVIKAYNRIDSFTKGIDKISKEGLPKELKKRKSKEGNKGLLSRSNDMQKYNQPTSMSTDESINEQKLVIGYVIRIREAFEEVKNGRTTNTES
tara:strand:- start:658 stop:948 length:291 start_codon:yes stop_codon:yes gene_type:complete